MSQKALAVLVATGALVAGVAAVVVLSRGCDEDSSGNGVRNTRSPQEISSYWTDDRKRQATPG